MYNYYSRHWKHGKIKQKKMLYILRHDVIIIQLKHVKIIYVKMEFFK
jgi:hypothetical protein